MEKKPIDAAYVNSLVNLINACRAHNVKIDKVSVFLNGWHVTFEGYPHADAICHDGSYGSPCFLHIHKNDWSCHSGMWETIGFPWDEGDVSIHTPEELATYIEALNNNETPWENNEDY